MVYNKYPDITSISLLILVTFFVFHNSLGNYFLAFDDFSMPSFYDVSMREILISESKGAVSEGNYRPIEMLSHKIDHFLFGRENVIWRHLVNLFIHIFNIILVYALSYLLTKKRSVGLIAAFLFSLHFIHSYSHPPVSWITGRVDPIVTLFFLLSIISFIKFRDNRIVGYYAASILFFVFALLTKEMVVTLPLMILLYLFLFNPYLSKDRIFNSFNFLTSIKVLTPYFLVLFIFILLRLKILGGIGGNYYSSSFNISVDAFFRDIYAFLGLMFPVGKDYNNIIIDFQINYKLIFYLVGLAIAISLILIFIKLIKTRAKVLIFSFLWVIITVIPVHNIILPLHQFQQRYLYLPLVGFCIFVAIILIENKEFFFSRFSKSLSVGILILFFCLSSYLIINHHNKIAESGSIMYGFQKDMQNYSSLDLENSNLYFITFPMDPMNSRSSVFIASGYMNRILQFNIQNYHKSFNCNIIFHIDEKRNSWKINWLSDKSFIIDDINPSNWFVIPSMLSELDRKREAIYGRIPHPLMVPLSSVNETINCRIHDDDSSAVVVKVIPKNDQYKKAKLEVELIDAPKLVARKSLFFIFKEKHFQHVKTINIQ